MWDKLEREPDADRRQYGQAMSEWDENMKPMLWRTTYTLQGSDELYSLQLPGDTERPIQWDKIKGILISKDKLYTPLLPEYTIAPVDVDASVIHVKRPILRKYRQDDDTDFAAMFRSEIEICELLLRHPHPNLIKYHGVIPDQAGERVAALCFERHGKDLRQAIKDDNSDNSQLDKVQIMADIKKAIEHLHSLGYIHNDVNPNNILLPLAGGSSPATLADFDSCIRAGQPTGTKRGTEGFSNWTQVPTEEDDWCGWKKTAEFIGVHSGDTSL